MIELPDVDGAIVKRFVLSSHTVSEELSYFGPEMPLSAIAGLKGDKTESIVVVLGMLFFSFSLIKYLIS